MRALFKNVKESLKARLHESSAPPQQQQPITPSSPSDPNRYIVPPAPSLTDVYRYRYHHGTNLGSIFVLEKWLHPSMFPAQATASQTSELEAVKASVATMGANSTRTKWENHWQAALSDADLNWLAETAHCTTIRLPIGYFTLGPHFCNSTPFASYATIYVNAWATVKSLVDRCGNHGIGVLIDLHALPGGANNQDHSGTNSGVAELWANKANLDLATKCLTYIAQEVKNNNMANVTGIQLCNEADYNAKGIYEWYDNVLSTISQVDSTMPLYISDAWDFDRTISYVQSKPRSGNPFIIDTHLYWAFSAGNQNMAPQQIISDVSNMLTELDGKDGNVVDRGAVTVFVGEYSCVMDGQSWSKAPADHDRKKLIQQFGNAQCARYQYRSGGCTFWTSKMDWMPGGEWGFVAMSNDPVSSSPAILPPPNLVLDQRTVSNKIAHARAQQDEKRKAAVDAHTDYWKGAAPGQEMEHWRFEAGWEVGFADAMSFFGSRRKDSGGAMMGGDKIGCLDAWVRKRIMDSEMVGGLIWEFEAGLRAGIHAFYGLAGI